MIRSRLTGLVLFGLLPAPLAAQVRASEPATVSQTVDGTKLTVTYSRPRARSRDSLFGKVVTWGEVWTPGANLATTLELSKNVKLAGHAVPKGKYSVWMVVRREGSWTVVLDPRTELFHEAHPDSAADQIRFPVQVQSRPFAEVLTWSFPEVRLTGATLAMHWGTTYVPVEIEVEPSYQLGFPADQAGKFSGSYDYQWKMKGFGGDKPVTLVVSYQKGSLVATWSPSPFPGFPEYDRFMLIRIKDDWFIPGFLDTQGALYEVAKEMVFEFKVVAGRAQSLEVRGEDDSVMASAKRKA